MFTSIDQYDVSAVEEQSQRSLGVHTSSTASTQRRSNRASTSGPSSANSTTSSSAASDITVSTNAEGPQRPRRRRSRLWNTLPGGGNDDGNDDGNDGGRRPFEWNRTNVHVVSTLFVVVLLVALDAMMPEEDMVLLSSLGGGANGTRVFGGDGDVLQSGGPEILLAPSDDVSMFCSDASLTTMDGMRTCVELCRPAKCCFQPSLETGDTCYAEFPRECEKYDACRKLMVINDHGSANNNNNNNNEDDAHELFPTTDAPYDLDTVCSDPHRAADCESYCFRASCCWNEGLSCYVGDGDDVGRQRHPHASFCAGYADPCARRHYDTRNSTAPSPVSRVREVCTRRVGRDAVTGADLPNPRFHRGECLHACSERSCCFLSPKQKGDEQRRGCYEDNELWCREFDPCRPVLLNTDHENRDAAHERTRDVTDVRRDCAADRVVTARRTGEDGTVRLVRDELLVAKCQEACLIASCCFANGSGEDGEKSSSLCSKGRPDFCRDFAVCGPLVNGGAWPTPESSPTTISTTIGGQLHINILDKPPTDEQFYNDVGDKIELPTDAYGKTDDDEDNDEDNDESSNGAHVQVTEKEVNQYPSPNDDNEHENDDIDDIDDDEIDDPIATRMNHVCAAERVRSSAEAFNICEAECDAAGCCAGLGNNDCRVDEERMCRIYAACHNVWGDRRRRRL